MVNAAKLARIYRIHHSWEYAFMYQKMKKIQAAYV